MNMKLDPTKTVDQEFQELGALGNTGSINDRIYSYLSAYTGAINDRLNYALSGSSLASYAVGGISPVRVSDYSNSIYLGGVNGTFSANHTFTRSGVARYFDADTNILTTAADGVARTGAVVKVSGTDHTGVLIENTAGTNIIGDSGAMVSGWIRQNFFTPPATITGPDGVADSGILQRASTTGGTSSCIYGEIETVSTSTGYTWSIYAKSGSYYRAMLYLVGFTTPANGGYYFDLNAGTIGAAQGTVTGITPGIEDVGNGWYRISLSFTTHTSDTSGEVRIYIADDDFQVPLDGVATLNIYGPMLNQGGLKSYVPTADSTDQTRNAETLAIKSLAAGTYDIRVTTSSGDTDLLSEVHAGGDFTDASFNGLIKSILIFPEGALV